VGPQLFHAGAIIALADETATAAATWENPPGEFRPGLFPLTLQMSGNLIRNTDDGAEVVHRGRTTPVAAVRVSADDRQRLIAKLVATPLASAPPAVAAPAGPRGR
jgi:acyl-coenzyme A thioesterase PaaI-like protein